MVIISCPHCGAVFDLDLMRDVKPGKKSNHVWISGIDEKWYCRVCDSINTVGVDDGKKI